jgi:U4/U6 small nuclear ribonucleoprotein PRP31
MAESSLAADLLADFNDSDDEEEVDENGTPDISLSDLSQQPNGHRSRSRDFMELDGDEEPDDGDEDEVIAGIRLGSSGAKKKTATGDLSVDDDEETRKTKVENMHLVDVEDVRSVAGLMDVLEPVLKVGFIVYWTFLDSLEWRF